MLTDPLRLWSAESPFRLEVPLAMVGTAGGMDWRPFTGEEACWVEAEAAEEPATEGGLAPVTTSGVEAGFLVAPAAEAYEGAVEAAVLFGAGVDAG